MSRADRLNYLRKRDKALFQPGPSREAVRLELATQAFLGAHERPEPSPREIQRRAANELCRDMDPDLLAALIRRGAWMPPPR